MPAKITLDQIREAWDKGDDGTARDEDKTRKLADQYVAAHPDQFEKFADKSEEELVKALEVFRDAGFSDEEWVVQTWLFHKFEPRNIGGAAESKVRVPGS